MIDKLITVAMLLLVGFVAGREFGRFSGWKEGFRACEELDDRVDRIVELSKDVAP